MLDIKLLREDPKGLEKKLRTKVPEVDLTKLMALDEKSRELKGRSDELKAGRNALADRIGALKREKKDASSIIAEAEEINQTIAIVDKELEAVDSQLHTELASLPNIPMDDVKIALDPKENEEIRRFGEQRVFSFKPKNHVELGETLGLFDFVRGAKVTGTGWPIYKGNGARLEWALLNYMLDSHIKNGFTQIIPPHLVREEIMYGSGQLPKFAGQAYKLTDNQHNFYMIPTSEVVLNGMHADETINEDELPIKYVSYTPCFRREAGAAGSKERGLIRIHQFNKVEMFCFTTPEGAATVFDEMTRSAEKLLEGLGLHYRSMKLVTGDMSFAATKTIDIEVFLPGQERYYEVSSVSNCTDFQSRRTKIRCKGGDKANKPRFVYTLNGSGLATSRLMVALLENNQREDGSVAIPEALHKYLGGITELKPS